MTRSELSQIALRALAYTELATDDTGENGCEVFALLMQAVADNGSSETSEAVLARVIASLQERMVPVPISDSPKISRGSMRYD